MSIFKGLDRYCICCLTPTQHHALKRARGRQLPWKKKEKAELGRKTGGWRSAVFIDTELINTT